MERKLQGVQAFESDDIVVLQNQINQFLVNDNFDYEIINLAYSTSMLQTDLLNGIKKDTIKHFALLTYNADEKSEEERQETAKQRAALKAISDAVLNK